MTDALTSWLENVVGSHTRLERLPSNIRKWNKGQSVSRVNDEFGGSWVLKRVSVAAEWTAEVHAYRHWLTGLGDHVPRLRAADETLRVLLLSDLRASTLGATTLLRTVRPASC